MYFYKICSIFYITIIAPIRLLSIVKNIQGENNLPDKVGASEQSFGLTDIIPTYYNIRGDKLTLYAKKEENKLRKTFRLFVLFLRKKLAKANVKKFYFFVHMPLNQAKNGKMQKYSKNFLRWVVNID